MYVMQEHMRSRIQRQVMQLWCLALSLCPAPCPSLPPAFLQDAGMVGSSSSSSTSDPCCAAHPLGGSCVVLCLLWGRAVHPLSLSVHPWPLDLPLCS